MDIMLETEIALLALRVVRPFLQFVFSDKLALDFLFGGKITASHQTKFALEKFTARYARYAESIDNLNRAIVVSVAFVPIALLPAGGEGMKIPLIDLHVTNQNWLRVCPAISYCLQIFTLVALCWFLIMRKGLDVLKREVGSAEHFGDVSNIMLTGVLGTLWMFVSIRKHFPSRLHLLWFLPLGFLFFLVMLSPSILCGYFVCELFISRDFYPALVYSSLLIPSLALSLILMAFSIFAGMSSADWERFGQLLPELTPMKKLTGGQNGQTNLFV